MSFFEIKHLGKSFGNIEVLRDINFTMEKGEVLAIIGSSGSGKTTLLRCINFLETPNQGQMILDGKILLDTKDPATMAKKEIRKKTLHFGMVFQSFNLFPQYTALKNVMLARELIAKERSDYKEHKKEIHQEIEEHAIALLERMGLADRMGNYPQQLSGGQQQRVSIARALAMEPDILCFDEPTSALDPELTGEVLKVIRELKDADSTMIVVTHEMEFARNVADKIIFMADGLIEEWGTPDEVFGNPKSPKTQAFLCKSLEKI